MPNPVVPLISKVCDAEDDHMAFTNAASNGKQGNGQWESGYVETVQVVNASIGYGPGRLEIRGYGGQGFAARYRVCSSAGAILPQGATIGHLGNVMCQVFALHTLHLHVFHASSRARAHTHKHTLPHTHRSPFRIKASTTRLAVWSRYSRTHVRLRVREHARSLSYARTRAHTHAKQT